MNPDQRDETPDCRYWFGDLTGGEVISVGRDPEVLAERAGAIIDSKTGSSPDGNCAIRSGLVSDRAEYLSLLRDVCIAHAKNRLAVIGDPRERELIHLVRILADIDDLTGTLQDRIADYFRGFHHTSLSPGEPGAGIPTEPAPGISFLATGIERMKQARKKVSEDIRVRAEILLPNTSALAGPLVAARMLERSGSLMRLSRLSASSIQVLGAETALFSHLTRSSPSPKHGIIYQHKRIHVAPKRRRGRVSRVFACRMAIAARIDYYRKERDDVFIADADARIRRAGER